MADEKAPERIWVNHPPFSGWWDQCEQTAEGAVGYVRADHVEALTRCLSEAMPYIEDRAHMHMGAWSFNGRQLLERITALGVVRTERK